MTIRTMFFLLIFAGIRPALGLGTPGFHLACRDTYGPKLDLKTTDQELVLSLRDTVADNYRFVQSLFPMAEKPLPSIPPDTEFSLNLRVPTGADQMDLSSSVSQILPGFTTPLLLASSVYKQVQPSIPVDVALIGANGQTILGFRVTLIFSFLETTIRAVQTEHVGPVQEGGEDMMLSLLLSSPGYAARAELDRVFSPFTCQ